MLKLLPHQYTIVHQHFHKEYPNLPFIFGILESNMPGEVWVDNLYHPDTSLIITNFSYCFIGGLVTDTIFKELFELIKSKALIKLYYERNNQPLNLSQYGFTVCLRREYRYKNPQQTMPVYENNTNYVIKKIENQAMFKSCLWYDLITSNYGTSDNFIKKGMGFILWDEKCQQIASESYGIVTSKLIEIGTITRESYRNQKLSTLLCNHLIHYAVDKGLQPSWTCDDENIGSWKVAEHQGMNRSEDYEFHILSQII